MKGWVGVRVKQCGTVVSDKRRHGLERFLCPPNVAHNIFTVRCFVYSSVSTIFNITSAFFHVKGRGRLKNQ